LTVVEGGGTPPPSKVPAAPDWIKAVRARALWSRLVPELLRRKQYIGLFEIELGRYCVSFGEYVEAQESIEKIGLIVKTPNGFPIQSPYVVIRNRQHEIMLRLAADLGLNPVAQMRLDGVQLDLFDQSGAPLDGADPEGNIGPFARFRAG
jgi:P27 family predicted phage terminase small subunit